MIDLLEGIRMPVRYIGGEYGSITKEIDRKKIRILLAFPDTYEIGMSYLGFRILYRLLNDREDVYAERTFAPWPDMEKRLREREIPLFSLETRTPADQFDIIGFSMQYELGITNLLTMLDLGNIPVRSSDRSEDHPLIIAGGPVVTNPEPYSPFIDLFFIGEAEEGFTRIIDIYLNGRSKDKSRKEILEDLNWLESVYVPELSKTAADPATGKLYRTDKNGNPLKIRRRTIVDLQKYPYPVDLIVPYGKVVQDKVSVELSRGCGRGCRFCQAGYIYLPPRDRPKEEISSTIESSVKKYGYDEVSLTGLTPTDYHALDDLVLGMNRELKDKNISLSISSIRTENIPESLLDVIGGVRKTGFTLAPEAGTDRMRRVINKNLSEQQILESTNLLYKHGWSLIKLYFMIGLPTETDSDLIEISRLAEKILSSGRKTSINPRINLSISTFIPKPHTPFQWEPMDSMEEIRRKIKLVRRNLRSRRIEMKYHEPELSYLEGLLSRGDVRIAEVIQKAWELGARFDGWADFHNFPLWQRAIEETGLEPEKYINTAIPTEAHLPWEHIDVGVNREFLLREQQRAYAEKSSPGCGAVDCTACGVCEKLSNEALSIIGKSKASDKKRKTDYELPADDESTQTESHKTEEKHMYTAYYEKKGIYRYLSHFDIMKTFPKALRRAGINLAYSRGYHPKPIMSFPPPVQVGMEAERDFFDFTTAAPIDSENILEKINSTLPEGLRIKEIEQREDKLPLSKKATGAVFSVKLKRELAFSEIKNYYDRWQELWKDREELMFEDSNKRQVKAKDLKVYLITLELDKREQKVKFSIKYRTEGTVNPRSFLEKYFREIIDLNSICREQILLS